MYVSVYVDDVLIFSRSVEEHIQHLGAVLECMRTAKLKLKPTKCKLLREEVEYQGHMITPNGLKPTRYLDTVRDFPVPASVKQTRQFLGLVSYYRRFIQLCQDSSSTLYAH